jgi:hypothetical protein
MGRPAAALIVMIQPPQEWRLNCKQGFGRITRRDEAEKGCGGLGIYESDA